MGQTECGRGSQPCQDLQVPGARKNSIVAHLKKGPEITKQINKKSKQLNPSNSGQKLLAERDKNQLH